MITKQYIVLFQKHLPDISSILEIQCGDCYDIDNCEALQNKDLLYIGVDISNKKIRDNRQYFRHEKNKIFIHLDAVNEAIPKADLVICKEVSLDLSISNIWMLLKNIYESESKYFAFDYYKSELGEEIINADINQIDDGEKKRRAINLSLAPFYFPEPESLIPNAEGSFIALYQTSKLSLFIDWYYETKLRRDVFDKLENDFEAIRLGFIKENNGEKLFEEMMVNFTKINASNHEEKYWNKPIYNKIILKQGILENRNNFFRLVYENRVDLILKDYGITHSLTKITQMSVFAKNYIRWKLNLRFFAD